MSQRTLGDAKAQARIDEVERAREIGERLGKMDERAKEIGKKLSEMDQEAGLVYLGQQQLALQGLQAQLDEAQKDFAAKCDQAHVIAKENEELKARLFDTCNCGHSRRHHQTGFCTAIMHCGCKVFLSPNRELEIAVALKREVYRLQEEGGDGRSFVRDVEKYQLAIQGLAEALREQEQFLVGLSLTVGSEPFDGWHQAIVKKKESLKVMTEQVRAALATARPFLEKS